MKARIRLPRWRALPALGVLARDLGGTGLAGLLLLGAAAAGHGVWLAHAREEARAAGTEVARLRARRIAVGGAVPVAAPGEALRQFRERFPASDTLERHLASVERLAREHRLVLASGDYRLVEEGVPGVARYEAQWPVRGQWRDLVGMLAALLDTMPHASLDELVIQRESRAAAEVEARVRVSLHVRSAEPNAPAVEPDRPSRATPRALPAARGAGGSDG